MLKFKLKNITEEAILKMGFHKKFDEDTGKFKKYVIEKYTSNSGFAAFIGTIDSDLKYLEIIDKYNNGNEPMESIINFIYTLLEKDMITKKC